MENENVKCPKCGSKNTDRHWKDKLLRCGAELVGGFLEGYFIGGSGETGGEIATSITDEIIQKYECKDCGHTFLRNDIEGHNTKDDNIKVCKGKHVVFTYKLYNKTNAQLLFETPANHPDYLVYGVSKEIVPGLLATMDGLEKGDQFYVTLPPEVAFGPRIEEYVQQVPIEAFIKDGKVAVEIKEGSVLEMMTKDGNNISGRVTKISSEYVEMDFNHPFAGLTVTYEGKILDVTDEIPTEIINKNIKGTNIKDFTQNNIESKDTVNFEHISEKEQEYLDELIAIYSYGDQISERENKLLNKLKHTLGISEERAIVLEKLANLNYLNEREKEYADEIKAMLSIDMKISDRERRILNKLATSLGISPFRAKEIERIINNMI